MWYKYLILIIFALLAFILFMPIDFCINYDKKWNIKIKILGLKFKIPSFKSKNKKSKSDSSGFKNAFQNLKSRGWIGSIKYISSVILLMGKTVKIFLRKIKIKHLSLRVSVSGEDAFETAIKYGQASGVIYPACNYLKELMNIKELNLLVEPDFKSFQSNVFFKTRFRTNIFNLLVVTIGFIKSYASLELKYRKEE